MDVSRWIRFSAIERGESGAAHRVLIDPSLDDPCTVLCVIDRAPKPRHGWKVIRSFIMKSGCRSCALAAASSSALGINRRKIIHTSTSIWAMPVTSSAPIALRYSTSIRAWAQTKLIRQIVLTLTWTELERSNAACFVKPALPAMHRRPAVFGAIHAHDTSSEQSAGKIQIGEQPISSPTISTASVRPELTLQSDNHRSERDSRKGGWGPTNCAGSPKPRRPRACRFACCGPHQFIVRCSMNMSD